MGPGRRPAGQRPGTASAPGRVREDGGAAALEFALVALPLLTLLFGIFTVGWGLWEYQAARDATREAARLASVGIPDATGYRDSVLCLAQGDGLPAGRITTIALSFHASAAPADLATTSEATTGGYATVALTYSPAATGLPLIPWPVQLTTRAVARVEQVATTGVRTGTTFDTTSATEVTCS